MPTIRYPGVPFPVEADAEEASKLEGRKQAHADRIVRNLGHEKRALAARIARARESRAKAEEIIWRVEEVRLEVHRRRMEKARRQLLGHKPSNER
jgi:hypothetical protein